MEQCAQLTSLELHCCRVEAPWLAELTSLSQIHFDSVMFGDSGFAPEAVFEALGTLQRLTGLEFNDETAVPGDTLRQPTRLRSLSLKHCELPAGAWCLGLEELSLGLACALNALAGPALQRMPALRRLVLRCPYITDSLWRGDTAKRTIYRTAPGIDPGAVQLDCQTAASTDASGFPQFVCTACVSLAMPASAAAKMPSASHSNCVDHLSSSLFPRL